MNISIQKLLSKIAEELNLAQQAQKEESLREKVYSIKILCELILDEKQAPLKSPEPIQLARAQKVYQQQPIMNQPIFQQPVPMQQPKKLEMENEANGDSLFDF